MAGAVCTSHGKVMGIPHLSVKEMDSILCKEKGKGDLERKKRVALGYKTWYRVACIERKGIWTSQSVVVK